MQIDFNHQNRINFKGLPVAAARVVSRDGKPAVLSVFNITHKDTAFLNNLAKSIDVEQLQDGFRKEDYRTWNDIIKNGISGCAVAGRGYLLAQDNIPCGVLRYQIFPRISTAFIQDVATWPVEKNKKVPFAGKTLFMQLFKDALNNFSKTREFLRDNGLYNLEQSVSGLYCSEKERLLCDSSNINRISLVAIKDSPYSPVLRYSKLGFKPLGGNSYFYENMRITRPEIQKSLRKLENLITYFKERSPREINFNEILRMKKD